ncbi:hypothetical protein C8R48DRAFT_682775 [Suillus tomentosus]|nr:hypothetical protein C8R48DRAFT_682775 [Suillus tomentosus]
MTVRFESELIRNITIKPTPVKSANSFADFTSGWRSVQRGTGVGLIHVPHSCA